MSLVRSARMLLFGFLLLLILPLGGSTQTSNQKREQLAKDVQAVADALRNNNALEADRKAKAIADREGEIYYVMILLKPRDKQGFGVGQKPSVPDGIEPMYRHLSKNQLSKQKLKAETDALVEMGYRTAAAAKIHGHLPLPVRGQAIWKRVREDFEKNSLDFIKAVKTGDPGKVQTAAILSSRNCNHCHFLYRMPLVPVLKPPIAK
jgi:hypothetical protein